MVSVVGAFALAALGHAADALTLPAERYELVAGGDSKLTIHVPRAGMLRFLGHNHTIETTVFSGVLRVPGGDAARAAVTAEVPVGELQVVDGESDPDTRAEVRDVMLGAEVLDQETFPGIRFESTEIRPRGGNEWEVLGRLTIRDVTREIAVKANLTVEDAETLTAEGSFPLEPEDFGIAPVSALGGTVRTADEIEIRFSVKARPATE